MHQINTEVLVVGGGTGGVAAGIQSSRRGAKTILVSESAWLGGMLTAGGVCAPDGNELAAWQTGLWGAYLRELKAKQPGGLDNGWVSLFTYHPHIGVEILSNWVKAIPNLQWIAGYQPLAVIRQGNKITGVQFADFSIAAQIVIDCTELGDLLALGEVPCRWGWELQTEFDEPSAPIEHNQLTNKYPVQAPTWVFMLQNNGDLPFQKKQLGAAASNFDRAWENYGAESFLNYGKLQDNLYMINWPICGNDYGEGLERLFGSATERQEFLTEAYDYSYHFAAHIHSRLGNHWGLAKNIFPHTKNNLRTTTGSSESNLGVASLHSGFALHPYYRESRRLKGQLTITEQDILPQSWGTVASLPINSQREVNAIAIGNYANDHHYPGFDLNLQPKSIYWGGRLTGTPFTIPYQALVPESIEGLLVGEKNISVSHIANGSTRLQPVVMNIGQAAGMAAALCVELDCYPHELSVRKLQLALLTDKYAPGAAIPLYNLSFDRPDWLYWQQYYLDHPENYPLDGNCDCSGYNRTLTIDNELYQGEFHSYGEGQYVIRLNWSTVSIRTWKLITVYPDVFQRLQDYPTGKSISVVGRFNFAGNWLLVETIL